ncbi:MAG: response regulator [Verrucomicrobia bacterium]|jgi:putative two-component system response regulator|nr:response regulator [Verrucomicrobiota bacterium]MBT7701183.1 response regulator [Verrucomicrobiota bacterium]
MKKDNLRTQMTPESSIPRSELRVPRSKVLVVDDEKSIRLSVQAFLRDAAYDVDVAEDALSARALLAERNYDVVVSDIVLPGASGVTLLQAIREASPDVQVIMMTGEPTVETASEAVRAGASDYLAKPVTKSAILTTVFRAAETKRVWDENRRLQAENRRYQESLEQMVAQRTTELSEALEGMIRAMSVTVETRDPYTAGHEQRVAELARAIGDEMGCPEETVRGTYYAGLVHDVGKISVPAEILSSPARLCEEEMGLIRKHPETGARILGSVHFPWPLAEIVLQHHERQDGSGYPLGLSGDAIRMEARILAVADVVEAMASHRPYRPALGIEAALAEVVEKRATLYDATVVDACVRLFGEKGFSLDDAPTTAGGA